MRIIAGKYRGRKLKSPPSLQTRPTSDRLRETLFNILAPRIEGASFLDLCAGSGAVGIEALSRGAAHVTFVDLSRKMCALIESNLGSLRIHEEEIKVVCSEAAEFLRKYAKESGSAFNVIFFDPPYAGDYERVLTHVSQNTARFLATDALLIVEHHRKIELSTQMGGLRQVRLLKQGDSALSFYETAWTT